MDLNKLLQPAMYPPKWLLIVIAAGIATSAGALVDLTGRIEHASSVEFEIAQLKKSVRPHPTPSKADQEHGEQWAKLQAERNFEWYPIFLALERASSEDIELLEFRPDKANRQLVLRGDARDMNALTKYIDRLTAQKMISQPYLRHQKLSLREGLQVISFEIQTSIDSREIVSVSQHR